MSEITVTDTIGDETAVPEHIIERTANLLGDRPMTNQRVILDTADWYLENAGNCAIYRWCIHHLDSLEHDDVIERVDVYSEARTQATEMGLDV